MKLAEGNCQAESLVGSKRNQQWGYEPLTFAGKYNLTSTEQEIIEELKSLFNLQEGWAKNIPSWMQAFKFLLERAEEKGIIVLINGIVGNNTHRKLKVEEIRGFVLYDEISPVVFINNNDAISAKIFTLIHEIIHILIGQSVSFNLKNLQSADNDID